MKFKYGMRLRGFSIGCQPMDGLLERQDDPSGRYYDILVYNRRLTDQEVMDYELDEVTGMNKELRIKMIKAMEYIARNLNDEEIFEPWLSVGVADGDIEYGDLDVKPDDLENLEFYAEDDNFKDLMALFLRMMKRANESGGLYCDGVVSSEEKPKKWIYDGLDCGTCPYCGWKSDEAIYVGHDYCPHCGKKVAQ